MTNITESSAKKLIQETLVIPERIVQWSEHQPLIKQLVSGDYGKKLLRAYSELKTDYLYRSPVHGIGHVERVMLFASLIAMLDQLTEKDTDMLLLCCAYHDVGRRDDSYDEEHGMRSAEIIQNGELQLLFDDCVIAEASIAAHSMPDSDSEKVLARYGVKDTDRFVKIFSYLKDADNIDRVRLTDFDVKFLRHDSSVEVSRIAEWVFYAYERKHTVFCFGDSNTYGYNPQNDGRYPEFIRWTNVLQRMLGRDYHIIPEGLNGRTTAFVRDGSAWKNGLVAIEPALGTHFPIDSLIIMLGTNDCCASLDLSAEEITSGLERLIITAWEFLDEKQGYRPNTIVVAPPVLNEYTLNGTFGFEDNNKSLQVSAELGGRFEELSNKLGCKFLNLEGKAEFSQIDGMHLTMYGHYCTAALLSHYFK